MSTCHAGATNSSSVTMKWNSAMAMTAIGPKMRPTPQYRRKRSISGGEGVASTELYTVSVRCATSGQLYESLSWAWKAIGSVKRHSGMA